MNRPWIRGHTRQKFACRVAMVVVLASLVCGCALPIPRDQKPIPEGGSKAEVEAALARGLTPSQVIIKSGIEFLRSERFEQAQSMFNTALKFDVNNAKLHFLNALTYHVKFLQGQPETLPLAVTGYRIAMLRDPSLEGLASYQLGRLYIEAGDYASARLASDRAVADDSDSVDALYLLAQASALEGDLERSSWAMRKLEVLQPATPSLHRLNAILAAVSGQTERARFSMGEYERTAVDAGDIDYVKRRVKRFLAAANAFGGDGVRAGRAGSASAVLMAQNDAAKAQDASAEGKAVVSKEPLPKGAWYRCDTGAAMPNFKFTRLGDAGATDESIYANPLPEPCPSEMPLQAQFDVIVIETLESSGTNLGLNALDGLSAIWNLSRNRTSTATTGIIETIKTNNLVLSNYIDSSSVDVLNYSLNIANSAYSSSAVMMRPSINAIDRVPSILYSGATYTIAAAGTAGTASTVVDKPVGVSLSITPTFVDEKKIMLSLRMSRATTVPTTPGSQVILAAQRSVVTSTALVNIGDAFVLGNLAGLLSTTSLSGVPVLQDIPVLNYLFKRTMKTKADYSYLIFVVVRPSQASATTGDALQRLSAVNVNFDKVMKKHLSGEGNELGVTLAKRDMVAEDSNILLKLKESLRILASHF